MAEKESHRISSGAQEREVTLPKALKTGYPFRRPHLDFYADSVRNGAILRMSDYRYHYLSSDDIMATDWEVDYPIRLSFSYRIKYFLKDLWLNQRKKIPLLGRY